MNELFKLSLTTVYGNFILISGLYLYHDWKADYNMRKLIKLENVPGDEMEIRRLMKAEYEMSNYYDLCRKYWQFKIFVSPPKIHWLLLPQVTEKSKD